uniref:Major facilitator superfamily (MFS) profile domain-containing protein n=1 Tax=Anopheles merus TaxID=30066 RepID=A0A182V3X0_ANOME
MASIGSWWRVVQNEKDRSSGLESDFEYRERWITIRLVYVSGFLMFLSFGVVTTGLWPYLQDMDPTVGKPFLSVVFAAPPAGQLIFSPLIGWCSNRLSSIRVPFVILTALFVFGNGLYSIVELFPTPHRRYVLLLARFVFGISTSINTLSRAYISTATKLSERTGAISMSSLAQTFGLAVGPIIQAALSTIGKEGLMWYGLRINMYTMAGWICAALGVVYILFLNPSCFVHRTIAAQEAMKTTGFSKATDTYEPLKMFSIWTVMIGYSVLMFFYVSVQTQTILSKLLGTRPQGNWMALYTSIGGLTRIIGPASVVVYVRFGTYWLFGLGAMISGLLLIWMWCYKSHLRTTKKINHAEEMQRMANGVAE